MPPRIFATEQDSQDLDPLFRKVLSQRSTVAGQNARCSKSAEMPSKSVSPTERLSKEFKDRLGLRKFPGFVEASEAFERQVGTRMLSRIRLRPTLPIEFSLPISSSELLYSDAEAEASDSTMDAIEACISAAVRRLELYPVSKTSDSSPQGTISIPHDQYTWLSSILRFQFSKQQLVQYGILRGLKQSHVQKARLVDCIRMILDEVWHFEKEAELPPGEPLVSKSTYPMHRD